MTFNDMNNSDKQIGIKKKNGHKMECNCPICVNIKHAKGGAGYDVLDYESNKKGGKKSKTNFNNPNSKGKKNSKKILPKTKKNKTKKYKKFSKQTSKKISKISKISKSKKVIKRNIKKNKTIKLKGRNLKGGSEPQNKKLKLTHPGYEGDNDEDEDSIDEDNENQDNENQDNENQEDEDNDVASLVTASDYVEHNTDNQSDTDTEIDEFPNHAAFGAVGVHLQQNDEGFTSDPDDDN